MVKRPTIWLPLMRGIRPLVVQWREFWRTPDPLLLHEGGSGEVTVALIRLLAIAVLLVISLTQVAAASDTTVPSAGGWTAAVAFVVAIAVYVTARRSFYRPWFGFATSILDVTLVTAALVVLLAADRPDAVVNSKVIYAVYFVAIGATALRYDARICVLVGLLAVMQYATAVAYADMRWPLNTAPYVSAEYGSFNVGTHYARLLLLFVAVLLSTSVALRTQRLRWLAAKDPLTKLLNRGFFDERMQAEVARTIRTGRPLSVALIDIDHFKAFNDNYGHIVGDEVLKVLGEMLLKAVRKSDLVARYGGEEFIILFPESPAETAVPTAERLRQLIAQSTVTVSIGVAELPTDGKDIRTIIDRADQRLYEAKKAGRNRVVGPVAAQEVVV